MKGNRAKLLRNRVAQEAALLLYTAQEKEYKQAKQQASATLGVRILPSNLEIAEELDIIAQEREGPQRQERILRRRKEAKHIMEILVDFSPLLVGSVWRGTARKNSDIDVHTFAQEPQQVIERIHEHNYKINKSEWRSVTKDGTKESSFHVQVLLDSADNIEIVVRSPENKGQTEKCETYGDAKTGLSLKQLTKVLENNPLQKFVPD